MIRPVASARRPSPAGQRLARLAPLSEEERGAIDAAAAEGRGGRARTELLSEGREISEARLLTGGWAAHARVLSDGRRQFLGFLLPGDLIGYTSRPQPLAVTTVVALTDVVHCPAPDAVPGSALRDAYESCRAMEEAFFLDNIVRLGRLSARERIGSLFLELHERLGLAGMVTDDGFELPLTQEILADALGLTSVHVNRMLQLMRREGDITLTGGRLTLPDPAALARTVGRAPVRVSVGRPAR